MHEVELMQRRETQHSARNEVLGLAQAELAPGLQVEIEVAADHQVEHQEDIGGIGERIDQVHKVRGMHTGHDLSLSQDQVLAALQLDALLGHLLEGIQLARGRLLAGVDQPEAAPAYHAEDEKIIILLQPTRSDLGEHGHELMVAVPILGVREALIVLLLQGVEHNRIDGIEQRMVERRHNLVEPRGGHILAGRRPRRPPGAVAALCGEEAHHARNIVATHLHSIASA